MTEAERKLLIWLGVLHLRTMRLTAAEADEIDGLIGAVRLSPIPQPAPEPAPPCDCCPVCGGDCGSANPPVTHCPMRPTPTPAKVAPVPVTEEMRKAAYLEAVAALDDGVPDNLYWDRILTAALAAAPPDPLREAVERYATQLTEQPSSVAHAIAHGLRAILETGRG